MRNLLRPELSSHIAGKVDAFHVNTGVLVHISISSDHIAGKVDAFHVNTGVLVHISISSDCS